MCFRLGSGSSNCRSCDRAACVRDSAQIIERRDVRIGVMVGVGVVPIITVAVVVSLDSSELAME